MQEKEKAKVLKIFSSSYTLATFLLTECVKDAEISKRQPNLQGVALGLEIGFLVDDFIPFEYLYSKGSSISHFLYT